MKLPLLAAFVVAVLAGCATPTETSGIGNQPVGVKLQPGPYWLTSFNSKGNKVAGPVKIDIPFNDQSFAVGAMCTNDKAARVVAKDRNERDAAWFECARMKVNM